MIERVNLFLHFRGEADAVEEVAALEAADGLADLGDFADARARVAVPDSAPGLYADPLKRNDER